MSSRGSVGCTVPSVRRKPWPWRARPDSTISASTSCSGCRARRWRMPGSRSIDSSPSAPEHASLYLLELYPNAPLRDEMARSGWSVAPDDDAADMYLDAMATLDAAGYQQYEISNVCRPGRESRHNLTYWRDGDWLAVRQRRPRGPRRRAVAQRRRHRRLHRTGSRRGIGDRRADAARRQEPLRGGAVHGFAARRRASISTASGAAMASMSGRGTASGCGPSSAPGTSCTSRGDGFA